MDAYEMHKFAFWEKIPSYSRTFE